MEKIEQPVQTWIATQSSTELDYIVKAISEGNATFLQLIKALGDFLTAEDNTVRANGLTLLTEVLARCSDKLNKQSTRVLCTFLLGKLEESENAIPALNGLNTLSTLKTFTGNEVRDTVTALFKHVNMRAHVQSTRHLVWTLLDGLVARHRETLKEIGADFLKGYAELAEGEKDPRNLLLAFTVDRVLLLEFDVKPHIEQFYDITFCYFPITFRPPPNDPYGITTADLQLSLRACLSASPFLGPLAMTLFLEKLNAGTNTIKIDTLQTIATCLPVYGQGVCQEHSGKLWSGLKVEIYQPTDEEVQNAALKATQVLLQTLYPSDEFEGLGPSILQDCVQTLKEPEKSKAAAALKVVKTLIQATPSLGKSTLEKIIPHFLTLHRDPQEAPLRPHILTGLSTVVEAVLTSAPLLTPDTEPPLTPYKDDLLATFLSGLNQSATSQASVDGLQNLVQIKKLLSTEELGFVVHNVSEHLFSSEADLLGLLNTTTGISPTPVEEVALPVMVKQLPDQPPTKEDTKAQARITSALAALRTVCVNPVLFEKLVIRLSTKIDLVAMAEGTGDMACAYIRMMLSTISGLLTEKLEKGHADVAKYVEGLVPTLYYLFLRKAGEDEDVKGVKLDDKVVDDAAEIISLVVSALPAERQRTFILSVYAAFFEGRLSALATGHSVLSDRPSLKLLQCDSPSPYQWLLPLLAAPFIATRPEVILPMEDISKFLASTLTWAITVENGAQSEAAAHLVAAILNKHATICQPFIETDLPEFWTIFIEDSAKSAPLRRRGIHLWTWVCRALLVRNHPSALPLIRKLFKLFDDGEVNWDAAKAMGSAGFGGGQLLTKRLHATVRLLFAQKFFEGIVHDIVGGHRDAATSPRMQSAYLVALASLIKAVSKATYARVMGSLVPLLLQGLDLPDADLRANVIEALLAICPNEPPPSGSLSNLPEGSWTTVSEHVGSLISRVLRNATIGPGQVSSVRLRIASLQLLGALAMTTEHDKVHPYKANVIRELQKALDDPKRAVRREAVEARAAWFKASS